MRVEIFDKDRELFKMISEFVYMIKDVSEGFEMISNPCDDMKEKFKEGDSNIFIPRMIELINEIPFVQLLTQIENLVLEILGKNKTFVYECITGNCIEAYIHIKNGADLNKKYLYLKILT